ncbi:hypothetical protein ElP_04290 [Tautonia plasticadhaerens]|uniref:Methanolan biosynthesis EpsI domain-containing protein n=2 Tax=Tautonia plasticadhaerens TaxID=2527974 RepID=A0A518GVH8_9BACT|nr:hypothetical protein ElP_04290 [Tautonia plasticadhaerens]
MVLGFSLTAAVLAAACWALVPRPGPEPGPAGANPEGDEVVQVRKAFRPVLGDDAGEETGADPRDEVPPEVREFLDRVLDHAPEAGTGVEGFRFSHWGHPGRPTRAAMGVKSVPGLDPDELIARVMDVDGYEGRIANVLSSRSRPDPGRPEEDSVRFSQRIQIPGIARVQQEAVLMDLGTIDGYRVACWYLLSEETGALNPRDGARSAFNVGAWLAAPGVVGYALNSWPRREDVNALQWLSLTTGSDALASPIVERTIDGMARWSRPSGLAGGDSTPPVTSTAGVAAQ